MLELQKVKEQLAALSDLNEEELERFAPVIAQAAAAYESSGDEDIDTRLALTAAARANYWIALAKSGDTQVTSFKAGDISITESADAAAAAYRLLEGLESGSSLSGSSSFVFRTV